NEMGWLDKTKSDISSLFGQRIEVKENFSMGEFLLDLRPATAWSLYAVTTAVLTPLLKHLITSDYINTSLTSINVQASALFTLARGFPFVDVGVSALLLAAGCWGQVTLTVTVTAATLLFCHYAYMVPGWQAEAMRSAQRRTAAGIMKNAVVDGIVATDVPELERTTPIMQKKVGQIMLILVSLAAVVVNPSVKTVREAGILITAAAVTLWENGASSVWNATTAIGLCHIMRGGWLSCLSITWTLIKNMEKPGLKR
nr:nonstructural protein 4B [West Nile virus]